MEITALIIVIALVRAIVSLFAAKRPVVMTLATSAPESLCDACAYAHIARGFRERDRMVACMFAGSVRPLKFAVSECTMFYPRTAEAQMVRVIGFAGIVDQSVSPSIAARTVAP
jgi:hypothetical protein